MRHGLFPRLGLCQPGWSVATDWVPGLHLVASTSQFAQKEWLVEGGNEVGITTVSGQVPLVIGSFLGVTIRKKAGQATRYH